MDLGTPAVVAAIAAAKVAVLAVLGSMIVMAAAVYGVNRVLALIRNSGGGVRGGLEYRPGWDLGNGFKEGWLGPEPDPPDLAPYGGRYSAWAEANPDDAHDWELYAARSRSGFADPAGSPGWADTDWENPGATPWSDTMPTAAYEGSEQEHDDWFSVYEEHRVEIDRANGASPPMGGYSARG